MATLLSRRALGATQQSAGDLLSDRIELEGDWRRMAPGDAMAVLGRMRTACLAGVRLVSDRQPAWLRVDEHTSGPPHIWLHFDGTPMAWVNVDTGEWAWCQLSYQFGHELGHVLANSWQANAKPATPCQWLEEALVEAFSLRGLARLAESWSQNPPFPHDNRYGQTIAGYRQDIIRNYAKLAGEQGSLRDFGAWFADHRADIEAQALGPYAQAASLTVLGEYERFPDCVEGLGALNRWPGRSSIPIADYLRHWEASCRELHASTHLPVRLRELLRLA